MRTTFLLEKKIISLGIFAKKGGGCGCWCTLLRSRRHRWLEVWQHFLLCLHSFQNPTFSFVKRIQKDLHCRSYHEDNRQQNLFFGVGKVLLLVQLNPTKSKKSHAPWSPPVCLWPLGPSEIAQYAFRLKFGEPTLLGIWLERSDFCKKISWLPCWDNQAEPTFFWPHGNIQFHFHGPFHPVQCYAFRPSRQYWLSSYLSLNLQSAFQPPLRHCFPKLALTSLAINCRWNRVFVLQYMRLLALTIQSHQALPIICKMCFFTSFSQLPAISLPSNEAKCIGTNHLILTPCSSDNWFDILGHKYA